VSGEFGPRLFSAVLGYLLLLWWETVWGLVLPGFKWDGERDHGLKGRCGRDGKRQSSWTFACERHVVEATGAC